METYLKLLHKLIPLVGGEAICYIMIRALTTGQFVAWPEWIMVFHSWAVEQSAVQPGFMVSCSYALRISIVL